MKMNDLFDYGQAHGEICCVLMGLPSPYGEAHGPYDQTHGSYGEAHGPQQPAAACNRLKYKVLAVLVDYNRRSIWNGLWFG
jgi:hypothetical protein